MGPTRRLMGHAVGEKNCLLVYECICVCMAEVVHRLLRNSGTWEWLKCKAIRDEKIYVFTVVCSSGAHNFWILFKGVQFLMVGLYYNLCAVWCSWCMLVQMVCPIAVSQGCLLGNRLIENEWVSHVRGGNASFGIWLDMPHYECLWLVHVFLWLSG